jgi:hypothetical protein
MENFNLVPNMQQQMVNRFDAANSMYPTASFPSMEPFATPSNHAAMNNSEHPAQTEVLTPPEINIQLAPPSRQTGFEAGTKESLDSKGLTPPERSTTSAADL